MLGGYYRKFVYRQLHEGRRQNCLAEKGDDIVESIGLLHRDSQDQAGDKRQANDDNRQANHRGAKAPDRMGKSNKKQIVIAL